MFFVKLPDGKYVNLENVSSIETTDSTVRFFETAAEGDDQAYTMAHGKEWTAAFVDWLDKVSLQL